MTSQHKNSQIQLGNAIDGTDQLDGQTISDPNCVVEYVPPTLDHKLQALADRLGLTYVDLESFKPASELFDLISVEDAHRFRVIPFAVENERLVIATSDPLNIELEQKLQKLTQRQISLVISSEKQILQVLERCEGKARILSNVSEAFRPTLVKENNDGKEIAVDLDSLGNDDAPVVRLVNSIVLAALQKRASDIHIQAHETNLRVLYRIDGVLYPATEPLDMKFHASLISRLKVMSELDIAEKRVPQDGRFKLRIDQKDIDFRVSVLPGIFGEDVVIRILDKTHISDQQAELSLEGLGFSSEILTRFRRAIRAPHGMVLITGPTGSGKTTSLYASLIEINTGSEKIITIEDPVEYELQGVLQIAVNEKKELTFAKGLRSILRHDPDKIMVGEIRDPETASIAVQSALTGHLVFTTIHANNVFDVVSRFCHMDVDPFNLVAALNCVVAQRLVRKLCVHCKSSVRLTAKQREELRPNERQNCERLWFHSKGCDKCLGTGYHGRSAIVEFLELTPRISDMILNRRPYEELRAAATEEGMQTLRQAAIAKAIDGETSLDEVNRVTFFED